MKRYIFLLILLCLNGLDLPAVEPENPDKRPKTVDLVILHTNDMHSQIEPISTGPGRGYGGFSRVYEYFKKVKKENKNVLLLDAGDYNQGTPYFTIFKGDLEMELMNTMGYEVLTIGNHELDNGQEEFARRLSKAKFPTVCANLIVKGTPLEPYIKPYVILHKGGLKIGVIGAVVDLGRLVARSSTAGTEYLDPAPVVNEIAADLKNNQNCDLIILLSHIGYSTRNASEASDLNVAAKSENVDIIVGGHSHTYLKEPTIVRNRVGKDVIVVQAGGKTEWVGRLDLKISPR